MSIEPEIKNFWEDKHKIKDVAALSGCLYDETIDFLRLNDYIVPGAKVLEIGPGLGYVTKGLFDSGLVVTALDISEEALNRVKDWCGRVFDTKDMAKLPSNYFDVIICNNVIQHIPTTDLIAEIYEVLRSLKSSGVFAVEFVSSNGFEDNGVSPNISMIQNGGLCRTPKYLESVFNSFGGECALVFDKKVDIGIVKGHHVFHVTKQGGSL